MRKVMVTMGLVMALWMGQASAQYQSYESAIYDACARYGCNGDQLVRVMYCESEGNPGAIGPNGELGLFQVDPDWWEAAYYGPYEQIEWAAMMWGSGHGYLWVCQ